MTKKKIAVLVSGGGTNLGALISAQQNGELKSGEISVVISSSPDAYALKRASDAGIKTEIVDKKLYKTRSEFTLALLEATAKYDIDLVVLAGFMYVIDEEFIARYKNAIINVHPALIPAFCGDGFYGLRPHAAALERGVKLTGATVHFVNGETDGGPIILQKAVEVLPGDTPEVLQKRVMSKAEHIILPRAVELFCAGRLNIDENGIVTMKEKKINVAVDGPSGAGKSTLAKLIASKFGYIYLDTGALYRSIGLYVRRKDADPKDEKALEALLPEIKLDIVYKEDGQHVLLCGEDVGDKIRTPEISMYASAVSAHPPVRKFLLDLQRNIAREHNCVLDGRDIGTVILPDADVKIFLSASAEQRAKRRVLELRAKGIDAVYEDVLADIEKRDLDDSTRALAPLKPASDAVLLDNSELNIEETLAAAAKIINEKLGAKN